MEEETEFIIDTDNLPVCRVCEQEGTFELNTNKFRINEIEILLITAFNCFSTVDNSNVEVYLCNSCTQALTHSYLFLEQVKKSEKKYQSSLDVEINSLNATTEPASDGFADEKAPLTDDIRMMSTLKHDGMLGYELVNLADLVEDSSSLAGDKIHMMSTEQSDSPRRKKLARDSSKNQKRNRLPPKYDQLTLSHFAIDNSSPSVVGDDDDDSANDFERASPTIRLNTSIALPQYTITTSIQSDDEDDALKVGTDNGEETSPRHKVKTMNISAMKLISVENQEAGFQNLERICSIQADDNSSIFKCKHCPKAFATAYHLMMHTRKAHVCQHCIMAFEKTTDLYKHIREAHSSFNCLMCKKVFRSNSNLRQHMRRNHSVFLPAHVSLLNIEESSESL